jgi:alkanesulfonate monooxygenase SsuD/methylene tetrahydromethanopterin reductase-like flavin-dependent oxidoreductase (luciferase family)
MQETQGGVQPHFTHNYDPLVAIAYAAAATQTLRLGTGVSLVPQREPIATAKALASLDVLSHGRVLCGVGGGWIPEEIANHGIDPPTRWAVMDERVQAMRTIWTQDEAEYGCPTPACPWSSLVRESGSFRTQQGRQAATPTSPSPSKAPNPTLVR